MRPSFLLLPLCVTALLPASCARAQNPTMNPTANAQPITAASENLIENGGFEIPESAEGYAWKPNNWAKNEAEIATDTDNPHSGKRSQRLTLIKATNADNIQLVYPARDLKAGETYTVSFWVRGADNSRPIDVSFNQMVAPWKVHSMAQAAYNSTWTQFSVNLKISPDAKMDETSLMFTLRQETSVWIDDVSVVKTPDKSPLAPLVGNQVSNGSFEVGRDKWTANRPYWTDGKGFLPVLAGANDDWNIESVAVADAPAGNRVLHGVLSPARQGVDTLRLSSAFFPLRYGYPAQVSFWLKTEKPGGSVKASIVNGSPPSVTEQSKYFGIEKAGWQRYGFEVDVKPSAQGYYFFELQLEKPGEFWIDGVSVTDGAAPIENYQSAPNNAGWEQIGTDHPGNLYVQGESPTFRVLTEKPNARLVGRVVDLFGQTAKTLDVTAKGTDRGEVVLTDLPRTRLGAYKIELFPPNSDFDKTIPAVEIQYQVLPQLAPAASVTDKFFGGHAATLGASELRVAQLVGIRSIRFHRPELTKWMYLEPEKGTFLFDQVTPALKRAKAMGFDLYGNFDLSPKWAADYVEGQHTGWRGVGAYAPRDWADYRNYVAQTARAFRPYMDTWEVWNEPELDEFLTVPTSWKEGRAKLVDKLVAETRQALTESGSDVTLTGVASYKIDANLTGELEDLDTYNQLDAATFHIYGTDVAGLQPHIEKLQRERGRDGGPIDVWMTEGANTTRTSTWLRGLRIPDAAPSTALQQAAGTLKNMAQLKAMGVKRYYQYPGPLEARSGRRINDSMWAFGDDVMGNPLPLWSAYAAAVKMLEGAEPVKDNAMQTVNVGDVPVTMLRFQRKDGTRVTLVWAKTPVSYAQIAGLPKGQLFDLLGNALDSVTTLDNVPVYVVG